MKPIQALSLLVASLSIVPHALAHTSTAVVDLADPAYASGQSIYPTLACQTQKDHWRALPDAWSGPSYPIHGGAQFGGFVRQLVYDVGEAERNDLPGTNLCGTALFPYPVEQRAGAAFYGQLDVLNPTDITFSWKVDTIAAWATLTGATLQGTCTLHALGLPPLTGTLNPGTGTCSVTLVAFSGWTEFYAKATALADSPQPALVGLATAGSPVDTTLTVTPVGTGHANRYVASLTP